MQKYKILILFWKEMILIWKEMILNDTKMILVFHSLAKKNTKYESTVDLVKIINLFSFVIFQKHNKTFG